MSSQGRQRTGNQAVNGRGDGRDNLAHQAPGMSCVTVLPARSQTSDTARMRMPLRNLCTSSDSSRSRPAASAFGCTLVPAPRRSHQ